MNKKLTLISPDCGDTPVPTLRELLEKLPELQNLYWMIFGDVSGVESIPATVMSYQELCSFETDEVKLFETWIHGFLLDPKDLLNHEQDRAGAAVITFFICDGDTWIIDSDDSRLIDMIADRFQAFIFKD